MYQRSIEEPHKTYWEGVYAPYYGWHKNFKVINLTSIMFANEGNVVIHALQDLLLHFWKEEEEIPNYFFFQILYHELITGKLKELQCPIVNDCIPHIIQTKINGGNYPYYSYEEAMKMTTIHKMTYYNEEGVDTLKKILNLPSTK